MSRSDEVVRRAVAGWDALDDVGAPDESAVARRRLAEAYFHTFTTGPGQEVLADLVRLSRLTTSVPASADDRELRDVEGKRSLVNHVLGQMAKARRGDPD